MLLNGGAVAMIALALAGEGWIRADWQNSLGGIGVLFALFGAFLTMIDLSMIPGFVRNANETER